MIATLKLQKDIFKRGGQKKKRGVLEEEKKSFSWSSLLALMLNKIRFIYVVLHFFYLERQRRIEF